MKSNYIVKLGKILIITLAIGIALNYKKMSQLAGGGDPKPEKAQAPESRAPASADTSAPTK